jgi:hypothetical protein
MQVWAPLRGHAIDWARRTALLALVVGIGLSPARCSQPPAAEDARVESSASFSLALTASPEEPPPVVDVPIEAGQIELVLVGTPEPVDDLTVELTQTSTPEVTRWSVYAPRDARQDVVGRVVLPSYAITSGDYQVTLWRGDAVIVDRYRFRAK